MNHTFNNHILIKCDEVFPCVGMTMEIHTKPKSATKPHSGGECWRAALNAAQARTRVCSQSTCARAAAVERESS
jgi:hypothetical protein